MQEALTEAKRGAGQTQQLLTLGEHGERLRDGVARAMQAQRPLSFNRTVSWVDRIAGLLHCAHPPSAMVPIPAMPSAHQQLDQEIMGVAEAVLQHQHPSPDAIRCLVAGLTAALASSSGLGGAQFEAHARRLVLRRAISFQLREVFQRPQSASAIAVRMLLTYQGGNAHALDNTEEFAKAIVDALMSTEEEDDGLVDLVSLPGIDDAWRLCDQLFMQIVAKAFRTFDTVMDLVHDHLPVSASRVLFPMALVGAGLVDEVASHVSGPSAPPALVASPRSLSTSTRSRSISPASKSAGPHARATVSGSRSSTPEPGGSRAGAAAAGATGPGPSDDPAASPELGSCPSGGGFKCYVSHNRTASALFGWYGSGLPALMTDGRQKAGDLLRLSTTDIDSYAEQMFGVKADSGVAAASSDFRVAETHPDWFVRKTILLMQSAIRFREGNTSCQVSESTMMRAVTDAETGAPTLKSFTASMLGVVEEVQTHMPQRIYRAICAACGVAPSRTVATPSSRSTSTWSGGCIRQPESVNEVIMNEKVRIYSGLRTASMYVVHSDMFTKPVLQLSATTARDSNWSPSPRPSSQTQRGASPSSAEGEDAATRLAQLMIRMGDNDEAFGSERILQDFHCVNVAKLPVVESEIARLMGKNLFKAWRRHQLLSREARADGPRRIRSGFEGERLSIGQPFWPVEDTDSCCVVETFSSWSPPATKTPVASDEAFSEWVDSASEQELAEVLHASGCPPSLLLLDTKTGMEHVISGSDRHMEPSSYVVGFSDVLASRLGPRKESEAAKPRLASLVPAPRTLRVIKTTQPLPLGNSKEAEDKRRRMLRWFHDYADASF